MLQILRLDRCGPVRPLYAQPACSSDKAQPAGRQYRRQPTTGYVCQAWLLGMVLAWCTPAAAQTSLVGFNPQAVTAYGAILPAEKCDLSARREGIIQRILVKPGQSVKVDQPLVEMDSREATIRLTLAEQEYLKSLDQSRDGSAVQSAKAQLAKSEATLEANQKLNHKSELETFRFMMDIREKKAQLEAAQARHQQDIHDAQIKQSLVHLAQQDLQALTLSCPLSGCVSEQLKYPGDFVRPGDCIVRVLQLEVLMFRVEMDLKTIPPHRLAEFEATVHFETAPGERLSLDSIQLDRLIPHNLDSQYYYAIATIHNSQIEDRNGHAHWQLRPGMAGQVSFGPRPQSAP